MTHDEEPPTLTNDVGEVHTEYMIMTDVLDLETRRKIYDLIVENPGINLSRIAELLQVSVPLVDYHLFLLEDHELITIEKEKGYKRCFIKHGIGGEERQILSLLRQDIPLKIVTFLLNHPYSRHGAIVDHLGMSSPRCSYHLKKLVKSNIVKEAATSTQSGYIVQNEKRILELIMRYKPFKLSKMVMDTWEDFTPG